MTMRFRALPCGLAALLLTLALPVAAVAAPEIGKLAPSFEFQGEGRVLKSADYVGGSARKKGVVVAWFPKAFTPG